MYRRSEGNDYRTKLILILTAAFVKARYGNSGVMLKDLCERFSSMSEKDILQLMSDEVMKKVFVRQITGNGIVYRLAAKFKFVDFDAVNSFVNNELRNRK